jgi:hypothetical protein
MLPELSLNPIPEDWLTMHSRTTPVQFGEPKILLNPAKMQFEAMHFSKVQLKA